MNDREAPPDIDIAAGTCNDEAEEIRWVKKELARVSPQRRPSFFDRGYNRYERFLYWLLLMLIAYEQAYPLAVFQQKSFKEGFYAH
jgi:hypothetical protein